LSKSCQKVVIKLAKSCQKVSKNSETGRRRRRRRKIRRFAAPRPGDLVAPGKNLKLYIVCRDGIPEFAANLKELCWWVSSDFNPLRFMLQG
jgi:hypothetical protein